MDPIAKLFGSSARVKLLRLFLFNRAQAFSLSSAAQRAKLTSEDARKEMTLLVAVGVVKKSGKGSRVSYRADLQFEHFNALETFMRETTVIRPPELLGLFKKAGALRLLVLSGFFTGLPEAGLDILVVGDKLDERVLRRVVAHVEAELGREVRYASFATEDFRYRRGVYDRLIRDVLDYSHRILLDKLGI